MLNINVCVGSSCHLRGSYDIINMMKQKITELNLENKINLAASFCLGKCADGVSVKIGDEIVCGVTPENFDEIFKTRVLPILD